MYALLAERADAADVVAAPVFLAASVKPEEVASMSRRNALDEWLAAPGGAEAADEAALLGFLRSA